MAKKMTYADIAEKLSNAYNKYDSALQNATTDAEKNAATLMLKRVSDRMNQLMLDNQNQANEMDQKETAPDSPNQSIAQREMRMAKGGKLKPVPKGKKGKGLSKLPTAVRNKMGFMKDGGNLKPIPPGNKGLPMLAESVRNNMGYMQAGGSTNPFIAAPTYDRFNVPLYTGLNPGTSQDSTSYQEGFNQGIKNWQLGYSEDAIGLRDADNFYRAGKKDGFDEAKKKKLKRKKKMKKGGSTFPDLTGDGKVTFADILKGRGVFQSGGQLYDGITDDQITKELLEEAGILSGLGGEFNPRNPEHVKKLQEGLLGAYTGPGADTMLSGTELEFLGPDGPQSVNQAGVDGKFGIDTLAALQQFRERKNPFANLKPLEVQPLEVPNLTNAIPELMKQTPGTPANNEIKTGTSGATGAPQTKGQAIVNKIIDGVLLGTKGLEYMNDANTIRGMIAPPPMRRISPFFANTEVDINPQLQEIADNQLLNLKQRKQLSTKRGNVDRNTAGDIMAGARARGKLFAGKKNLENQLGMRVGAINKGIEEKNIKTDFDNAFQLSDFLNQRNMANRNLFSGVVQDAQDLLTQRTNKRSQEAQLQALAPYLNMYGAMNRAYGPGYFSDPQLDALFSNLGYVKQADGSYKPA